MTSGTMMTFPPEPYARTVCVVPDHGAAARGGDHVDRLPATDSRQS